MLNTIPVVSKQAKHLIQGDKIVFNEASIYRVVSADQSQNSVSLKLECINTRLTYYVVSPLGALISIAESK